MKALGMEDVMAFLAAHNVHLQHISHSHVILGLPMLMPICLGGSVPACMVVRSLARLRGLHGRQHNTAGDICSARSVPLWDQGAAHLLSLDYTC